jgi:hypothetical protein
MEPSNIFEISDTDGDTVSVQNTKRRYMADDTYVRCTEPGMPKFEFGVHYIALTGQYEPVRKWPAVYGPYACEGTIPRVSPSGTQLADNWRIEWLEIAESGERTITFNVPRNPGKNLSNGFHPMATDIPHGLSFRIEISTKDIQFVSTRPYFLDGELVRHSRGFMVRAGAYKFAGSYDLKGSYNCDNSYDSSLGLFFRMGQQRDLYTASDAKITWNGFIHIVNPKCPDDEFELLPFGKQGKNHRYASMWNDHVSRGDTPPPYGVGTGRLVPRGGRL